MAEDSLKNIVYAFIMIILFSALIITAVMVQGEIYGKDTTEVTGGSLDITGFNNSLNNLTETANSTLQAFEQQNIFTPLTLLGIAVIGIWIALSTFVQMILIPFTLIANIMTNVLHVPVIVTGTILVLITITIILAIWRALKVGS